MTTPVPQAAGDTIRRQVTDLLWPGLPARSPASATLCGRATQVDVTLDDLRLSSPQNPDDPIPAVLARPRQASGPLPAVVCLHGSGRSRGLLMEEQYRFDPDQARLYGWARELARRGFAVLAITQRTYGGRRGPVIQEWAKTELLYGRTAMGGLVEDALSGVDYLVSQCPDVDGQRIGMVGFSLGGIGTFYSAIVDTRIRAAVPVCGGVGSLAALVDHGNTAYHSTYFYVPRLLQVGDHPELVTAIVPRALLVIGADQDVGMPLDGLETFERRGRAVYEQSERPDAFAVRVNVGGHNFTPPDLEVVASWLSEHLRG